MPSDARLTDLESLLAHQTRTVEELSDIIHRQQKEIDTLTRRVTMLLLRAAEAEADTTGSAPLADQKPPHY